VLGVKPSRLRGYLRAGLVAPARGEKGELRFSFQDLVLLRKAEGLVTQRIPAHRIHDALRRTRETMAQGTSLHQVQFEAEGRQVVVSDGGRRWEPATGQVVFRFGATGEAGELRELRRPAPVLPPAEPETEDLSADERYDRGFALEEAGDLEGAMVEYRRAIEREPRHADAHVNLGRILHESARPFDALAHYRSALAVRPGDATAVFNLGVALEDLGRHREAIESYQRALAIAPDTADAHYNLARLFEQTGESESAIRHLLIYRKLTRKRK